jgi:hypothetical protein
LRIRKNKDNIAKGNPKSLIPLGSNPKEKSAIEQK